ncbi:MULTISPECIES: energy transducer TonB [Vibrio]|uniref:Protein TonB n=2 Tax=Vibrio harveyi group TaxID=717610 RepID=B1N0Q1_VIBAL|nr:MULTISPECIES: energy transducer TonB [Vibrio]EEZ83010.1 TonB2 protein [Vibrio alginolyticus 40B]MDF5538892.1 energy transducer TonB [Vibrio parahaemolyticus]MDW1812149.1 energy transducer TonB [Vibrio sp. Vb2362]MDW1972436.1 energy transducer TonB [Vibrio sp. 945]MDW2257354.1 energy transducer TonB [Vibrio sp. 1409]MDW2296571.1 energy transducer TonB [Vibrio sp. 1404]NAW53439.1 TonB family protein [Vibrio sp. V41_P2S12T139]NAW92704.1 TonB family protein [Vibrio sp. V42_P2S4T144]QCO88646
MGRLLLALPASLLISVSLFSFMAWMVDKGNQRAPEASEAVRFDMVMVENEADVQRRQRSVPEQPEPPQAPEPMDLSQADTQMEPMSQMTPVSALGLNTALEGIAISAPNLKGTMGNQQALPLYRVDPRYPSKALKRRVEGYVIMRFTIDATGRPKDIEVIEAEPERMFEREAIRALKKWKYQPKVEDGVSIEQFGQTAKVEFKLAK